MVMLLCVLAALIAGLAGLLATLPLWRAGYYRQASTTSLVTAALGVLLYFQLGTPAALPPPPVLAADSGDLASSAAVLRQSLADTPDQLEGWILLARAETLLGRRDAANAAWQQALTLSPDTPSLLTEAAQARADAHPQRLFDDTALQWLERARRIDPQAQRTLFLIGIAQRQRGLEAAAVATWESLLPLLEDSTSASVREHIDLARQAATASAGNAAETTAAAPPVTLSLSVALDPELAARIRLQPDTPVFVQARAVNGPPLPIAARRLRLADLPVTIQLSDADSVMPTQRLSEQQQVIVSARIAMSGSVARQDDDVETPSVAVPLPSADTTALILRP